MNQTTLLILTDAEDDQLPENKRERVYICASKSPADQEWCDKIGMDLGASLTRA